MRKINILCTIFSMELSKKITIKIIIKRYYISYGFFYIHEQNKHVFLDCCILFCKNQPLCLRTSLRDESYEYIHLTAKRGKTLLRSATLIICTNQNRIHHLKNELIYIRKPVNRKQRIHTCKSSVNKAVHL